MEVGLESTFKTGSHIIIMIVRLSHDLYEYMRTRLKWDDNNNDDDDDDGDDDGDDDDDKHSITTRYNALFHFLRAVA